MSANNTFRPHASWGFAAWAACLFVGWAGACGKTSQGAGKLADGSLGGAGGVKTDAGTGTGGAVGTGGMGADAGTGTGGAIGTGGVTSDAGAGIACTDDGGVGFAAVARQCTQDSDCTILTAATCCGADRARGIAKVQANAYAGCFALPSGACSGLGCAKYFGYLTDTYRPSVRRMRPPAQLTSDVARQVGANRPHAVPALSVRLALSARPRGWERIATDVPRCFALKATPVPATVAAKRVLPMPTTTGVFRYSARKATPAQATSAAKRMLPVPTATAACLPYAPTFHVRSTMSASPAN
jgi:hypothetical protein